MMERMYETQASKYGYGEQRFSGGAIQNESYSSPSVEECETNQVLMRLDEIEKRLSDLIATYSRVVDRLLGPIPPEKVLEDNMKNGAASLSNGVIGEIKIRQNEIVRKIAILERISHRLGCL